MQHKPTEFRLGLQVYQCQIVSALAAALLLWLWNAFAALSFSYGAIVILLGNGFLTWRVYQKHKSLQAMSMLWSFLGGEFGKYCLLILGTVLLAYYVKMNRLFYVIGLALPQILGVLIFAFIQHRKRKV
jgi:F0F1-type ATP synthase assembly protein I